MQAPVLVLNTKTERESGHKAQISNIASAKAVSLILHTTLGLSILVLFWVCVDWVRMIELEHLDQISVSCRSTRDVEDDSGSDGRNSNHQ